MTSIGESGATAARRMLPASRLDRLRHRHIGRAWVGHRDGEATCPCQKAACGLAIANTAPGCKHHGASARRTIRQSHAAADCPGAAS